ncbi:MAG: hypothetical protein ACKVI8_23250, partial [Paraglaciecola sp.]
LISTNTLNAQLVTRALAYNFIIPYEFLSQHSKFHKKSSVVQLKSAVIEYQAAFLYTKNLNTYLIRNFV